MLLWWHFRVQTDSLVYCSIASNFDCWFIVCAFLVRFGSKKISGTASSFCRQGCRCPHFKSSSSLCKSFLKQSLKNFSPNSMFRTRLQICVCKPVTSTSWWRQWAKLVELWRVKLKELNPFQSLDLLMHLGTKHRAMFGKLEMEANWTNFTYVGTLIGRELRLLQNM